MDRRGVAARGWLVLAMAAASCTSPSPADRYGGGVGAAPAPRAASEAPRVVVLSDLNSAYGSTEYALEVEVAVRRAVEEWRPDLVLIAGDMVAGQSPSLADARVRGMWTAFDSVVLEPLEDAAIPVAFTFGNHDASGYPAHARDRRIADAFWSRNRPALELVGTGRYPFYYAFVHGGVFFLVLDASTGEVVADSAQMAWIHRTLEGQRARSAGLRVSLGHVPLYAVAVGRDRPGEVQARPDSLRALLEEGGVDLHISGHHHAWYPARRKGLAMLHAGALGGGPRRLLAGDAPPIKTVTVLDLFPALDSVAERTFRVHEDQVVPLDPATLPPRIDGIDGTLLRRD